MNRARVFLSLGAILLVAVAALPIVGGVAKHFVAHPTGAGEVPPRETDAVGQAVFHLSQDGASLHYKLSVDDIENVIASHIHVGAPTVNGPVVVWLAGPFAPGGGAVEGIIGEGVITDASAFTGAGGITTLEGLLDAMRAGNTYVNVHTNDGVDPANTGAGDFPGGEIRAQIRPVGQGQKSAAVFRGSMSRVLLAKASSTAPHCELSASQTGAGGAR